MGTERYGKRTLWEQNVMGTERYGNRTVWEQNGMGTERYGNERITVSCYCRRFLHKVP